MSLEEIAVFYYWRLFHSGSKIYLGAALLKILKYLKFDSNSNVFLDIFPHLHLSKVVSVATSCFSGIMVNTTFLSMDKVI